MSDFIGPNTYYIVSREKSTAFIDLADGSRNKDTKVQIWDGVKRDNPNAIWEINHLGLGSSGKYEYHFLNRASGTYLTAPEKPQEGDVVTGNTLSPWYNRTRWCIIPCRNNTGAYWITPAADPKKTLNIKGGGTKSTTEIILWGIESALAAKNQQWFLRLADDAILNCPDAPRAPVDG